MTLYDTVMNEAARRALEDEARFELPGAPNFTQYLLDVLGGELFLLPKNGMWNMQINEILHNQEPIGIYTVSKIEGDSSDFLRSFTGKLPGYDSQVRLEYANKKHKWKDGELVTVREGSWERNDDFTEIPFP